jgi:hypothetical protein
MFLNILISGHPGPFLQLCRGQGHRTAGLVHHQAAEGHAPPQPESLLSHQQGRQSVGTVVAAEQAVDQHADLLEPLRKQY